MDLNEIDDKELQKRLDNAINKIEVNLEFTKATLSEIRIQYIQSEILRRNMNKLDSTLKLNIEATKGLIVKQEKTRKQAKIWSWTNVILAFIMICLAGTTIWYARNDLETDEIWIDTQEKLLLSIDSSFNQKNSVEL